MREVIKIKAMHGIRLCASFYLGSRYQLDSHHDKWTILINIVTAQGHTERETILKLLHSLPKRKRLNNFQEVINGTRADQKHFKRKLKKFPLPKICSGSTLTTESNWDNFHATSNLEKYQFNRKLFIKTRTNTLKIETRHRPYF